MIEFPATGQTGAGYLAVPSGGKGAGVLVFHAWWGLNDDVKALCDRLANAGFVALAPDFYDGKVVDTIDEAEASVKALDHRAMYMRAYEAMRFLRSHSAVTGEGLGAIGFSLGTGPAYFLSVQAPDDIAAVVVFYGAGEEDFSPARAAFLGHFAVGDDFEPDEYVNALEDMLRTAGRDTTFYRYDGVKHWFFEPSRPEYDAATANLAWERTIAFLQKHLA